MLHVRSAADALPQSQQEEEGRKRAEWSIWLKSDVYCLFGAPLRGARKEPRRQPSAAVRRSLRRWRDSPRVWQALHRAVHLVDQLGCARARAQPPSAHFNQALLHHHTRGHPPHREGKACQVSWSPAVRAYVLSV